jgi:hypothetical protein
VAIFAISRFANSPGSGFTLSRFVLAFIANKWCSIIRHASACPCARLIS